MTYSNGDVYTGSWENHTPRGKGTMIFCGGTHSYSGSFDEGVFHGKGKLDIVRAAAGGGSETLASYKGEWRYGLRSGKGFCCGTNRAAYEGDWLNNVPHGKGSLVDERGDRYGRKGSFGSVGSCVCFVCFLLGVGLTKNADIREDLSSG